MTAEMTNGAPLDAPVVDEVLVGRLREDLQAAGYTVDGVQSRLGPMAAAALHREQAVPADLVTRDADDPLAVLVRLLALGRPTRRDRVATALPRLGVDGAVRLGLVAPSAGAEEHITARLDLRPYGDEDHDWWVASDLSELATGGPLREDHVLGVGGASTTLASWTIRRPVETALDLGTGCGVQSLHLAQHAQRVVATDISTRALAMARLSLTLSGIDNVELVHGSMLGPVAGQRFSQVVSNPPFVITPRTAGVPRYEYRDGGAPGDGIVRSLVREVGAHLQPGGVAQLLGNWEVGSRSPGGRGDWRAVWDEWLDGTGLDAWVVRREVQDPAEYAELWSRDGGTHAGIEGYAGLCEAWLEDFAARGVDEIHFGVITLERPSGDRSTFRDLTEAEGAVAAPMGPAVEAGLRARTQLAGAGSVAAQDDLLLDTVWACAPDVTTERHGRPTDEDPAVILVRQGGGLHRVRRASTALAAYLSVADGSLTARQALVAIAALLEEPTDALLRSVLPDLRALVLDGLLTTDDE